MDARRRQYLELMGITPWRRRASEPAEPAARTRDESVHPETPAASDLSAPPDLEAAPRADLDWPELERAVASCTACGLHATRTQPVFGVGDRRAEWMIVGEAPGAEEDRQGAPFVGRAGQLLSAMLRALGLAREQVYIANVLKCRPPNNRDPTAEEAAACEAHLHAQIALVRPRILLVVGRVAAQNLLKSDAPLARLRGRAHRYADGSPLVVTYHPAYLLRAPQDKAKAWQDLLLARSEAAR
ncbi:uracil-DNA glycosylase [Ectothiorhodospiraceae bacterium 2226]|nr:uracil-DNA glycosylase [Ectothiorhodospiraceae bacterium 2226]